MPSIPRLRSVLQTLFTVTAEELAQPHGVIQRQRKLTAAVLLQTLVLGWLAHPSARLTQLTQMAARRGVVLTPQALQRRFTPALAAWLEQVFLATVTALVAVAEPAAIPLLRRFSGVWIIDSSTISLPEACAARWPGCGGRPGEGRAALKTHLRLDLLRGRRDGPELTAGRTQDRASALQQAPLPPGSLRISDLGYFQLAVFRALAAQGSFWLSRLRARVGIQSLTGEWITNLPRWLAQQEATGQVDVPVVLGVSERLPARLLAEPVPEPIAAERRRVLHVQARKKGQTVSQERLALADWTILVTNVPVDRLSLVEARSLYRARWQIELLFKLWKQHGQLDDWRSANVDRIMAEIWAKLIGVVLQHWLLLTSGWAGPGTSLGKAALAIQDQAIVLAATLDSRRQLDQTLTQLQRCLRAATRISHRRHRPATEQYLLDSRLEP